MNLTDEIVRNMNGETGYFLEFFFGKILNKYTIELMDQLIKEKVDLSVLLNTNLWHKKIELLNEYVKLKYFIVNKYKNDRIDFEKLKNFNIYEQIKEMKELIIKKEGSNDIEKIIKKFFMSDDDNSIRNNIIMKNEPKNTISKYKINRYFTNQSEKNIVQGLNMNKIIKKALDPNTSLREFNELYPLIKSRIFRK